MSLSSEICFRVARSRLRPPAERSADADAYSAWRDGALAESWSRFDDGDIDGKDVLDFGCGEGPLSLYLATHKAPRKMTGVDIDDRAIDRAKRALGASALDRVDFLLGSVDGLPVPDASYDTLLAFDCMEHVMDPAAILAAWNRVLRPGGKVLIEWFPFLGPWGPHMESLVPVPWAHVLFGERAVFETAERIYDDPAFVPRHWDLDENGNRKPNKWRGVRSFAAQGYLNELTMRDFLKLVAGAGFAVVRHEDHGFGDGGAKGKVGKTLAALPFIGEYFTTHALIELVKK